MLNFWRYWNLAMVKKIEIAIPMEELVYQNEEKEKLLAELIIANKKLVFQNQEKEKLAAELIIANEELKKAKDHQKECIQELEELLIITHKLRQPITQIVGLAILLTDSCYTQKELKKMHDMIRKSAQSLDNFSRELTTFTQHKKLE